MAKMNRILLTGAAGGLGTVLRTSLPALCRTLRLADIVPLSNAAAHEELVQCDLANEAAVDAMLQGCDAVVHMGGISVEGPWQPILQANIIGLHNLYEAARRHGVKRLVFASSNHAVGFHSRAHRIDATQPTRGDGNYGVSKVFGETLSRFYWDRYGIETVCLRIGSCFPEPRDRRMLASWLSYRDLQSLIACCLTAPTVEHTICFAASNNPGMTWWDNSQAAHLGWTPQDSAEPYRAKIEAATPPEDPADPATVRQGGKYVTMGPYQAGFER